MWVMPSYAVSKVERLLHSKAAGAAQPRTFCTVIDMIFLLGRRSSYVLQRCRRSFGMKLLFWPVEHLVKTG